MRQDPTAALATPAETEWVECELIRNVMRTARNTQLVGVLLIPLLLGVVADDAPLPLLFAWTLAACCVASVRFLVIRQYFEKVLTAPALDQISFFRKASALFPVSGAVWGLTAFLFFDRAPLADQFICWLVLAGLAMFSINSLSSDLRTMRRYLDALNIVALLVIFCRIAGLRFEGPNEHYWVAVLIVTFWQVLRQAGLRLHQTHRRNYELQYRNNQLIESLTRQTQAALEAVEIKNRFLASATHDIRQPVHALGLYADWLGSEPELVHEIAPKIVESTKAVNALFDSLFDLVRLDSGKIKLNIEAVDMARIMRELELQYRPLAQAKGLEFRVRLHSGTTVSDGILLRRIAGNLVSNAIKYTDKGGLLVALRPREGTLSLEVWDTGLGIAQAHQREIFREFYKVPNHPGTEDGFGLGLYIVARLSTILGHPVTLASRVGRGTVFRLDLTPTDPVAAARRATGPGSQLVSIP